MEDTSEIGKLFNTEKEEKQAKDAKIDMDVLKTTFKYVGGTALIAAFVLTDFVSNLISTASNFYEKDFYVLNEAEQRENLFTFVRNVILVHLIKLVIDLVKRFFRE